MDGVLTILLLITSLTGVGAAAALWAANECVLATLATAVIALIVYKAVTHVRHARQGVRARGPG